MSLFTENNATGSLPLYQRLKKNLELTTFDFKVMKYREFFQWIRLVLANHCFNCLPIVTCILEEKTKLDYFL